MLLYSQIHRNATLTDRHQPSCSQIITGTESHLQVSVAGTLLVLRLGRPDSMATVQIEAMGSRHSSSADIKNLSSDGRWVSP